MWTLPVVAVATAAPAFASSGSNLSTSSGTISSPKKPIEVSLTIKNTGSAGTCALTVRIDAPNAVSSTQVAPSGFTVTTIGSNFVIYTATDQLAAGAMIGAPPNPILFVVDRGNNGAGTVTVTINPGCGGTPGIVSGTAT